ncbi:MAG: type 4a pilus biogenesis protein PilO [Candidatus Dojkabacteria bacterium]|nr:type 4a pilus biogenesis protein PilO [Candidatus Dojkabacteria bacterium]
MAVVSYKDTMRRLLKSPMRKTFTFLGVTLIVLVIFLMGAIKPTLSTISRLKGEIRDRENVNEQMQTKINNIQALQEVYLSREEDFSIIPVYFPSDSDYSLLMASLEKVVNAYGFELSSLRIAVDEIERASGTYPGMSRVNVSLNVSGQKVNVVDLVEHLESLPVMPNLLSLSISPKSSEGIGSQVDMTISMYIFKTL